MCAPQLECEGPQPPCLSDRGAQHMGDMRAMGLLYSAQSVYCRAPWGKENLHSGPRGNTALL